MRVMDPSEWQQFLDAGRRSATISTLLPDGSPHAVPLWYVLDGDALAVLSPGRTVKSHNLKRDPRAAITIHDDAPPYSFVMARGRVTLSDDLPERRRIARLMATRYLGQEAQEAIEGFVEYASTHGMLLVRLVPEHVVAWAEMEG